MLIPEAVKNALRRAGLTAEDWRRVRAAFDSLPSAAPPMEPEKLVESIQRLEAKAEDVRRVQEQLEELLSAPIPAKWDQVEKWWLRRAWETSAMSAGLTTIQFAELIGMPKTTLYRKLREYGIFTGSKPGPKQPRPLQSAEAIVSEIESLTAELRAMLGIGPREVSA